jgi:subtilisin-like proprotein convertase family protein
VLALAFAAIPVSGSAHAKSPGPAAPAAAIEAASAEPSVVRDGVRVGLESGMPRALYHVNFAVDPADPETMARQYLRANRTLLRLDSEGLDDLVVRHTRRGLAGATVRFEQRHQGVPVLASDIAVTISHNRVTFVSNGYEPGISLASVIPAVLEEDARRAALDRVGVQGDLAFEATRLVVVPEGKTARLAWQVKFVPSGTPPGDWEVLVDAATGEIVRVADTALYVDGSGFVFDPDPLSTALATYGSAGYVDGSDATTAQLDAARATRTLLDITDLGGGTYKLQGPYATIVDVEAPLKGLFTQAGTTFNFNRAADAFEAVHTYYHVDQIMRHINVTLGIPLVPYQYAGGVRFDPHGLSGADNSHYTSSNGVIAFGEGGVDDAEDADVVVHELGHGIHDWLTAGGLSQVNGLSEGLGDYVAQSYSRSFGQWSSSDAPYHWVFNWDGHNPFWPGRITNYSATYPGGLVNQVHTDGQIWATCLMRIWDDVGRNRTDAAVFEGIAMTNSSSNQNDAAAAVLQAAVDMGYTPTEINSFVTNFQLTGYDVSIGVDYASHALVGDECAAGHGDANGIAEPGEEITLAVTIEAATTAQTGVTGVLTTTTPGVTIVDDTATWPDLTAGVPTASNAPHFLVRIADTVTCPSTIDFDLSVTSNEGGPYPGSFSRSVGEALTPAGLPLAIPDNVAAGATSALAVSQNVTLSDVNVRVQIQHTYVGDLQIKIRSPLGTEVQLLDRPGVPPGTFGCGDDNMDVTFDDAGSVNLETHCAGATPWYSGVGLPTSALSAFNGQASQGNWVLTVADRAGQDVGSVIGWELITTPPLVGACDPCPTLTGVPLGADAAAFRLEANNPNPFSPRTEIRFNLARAGHATLRVFDAAGREVRTLVDGALPAGPHAVAWDGTDGAHRVASGVYFYRLTSEGESAIRRMQLVR